MTASEVLAFLAKLPTNVTECTFNPDTGAFTVKMNPVAAPEPRGDKEVETKRVRDTLMLSRTAPIFGVEES